MTWKMGNFWHVAFPEIIAIRPFATSETTGPSASRHTPEDRLLLVNIVSESTSGSVLRKEGCEAPTDMDPLGTNT